MKILLINPAKTLWEDTFSIPSFTMPLGLGYIASYLKKHNYNEVSILDASIMENSSSPIEVKEGRGLTYGMSLEEISRIVSGYKPDIVGISCLFSVYYYDAIMTAEAVKKVFANVPIILGGAHASSFGEYLIKHPAVDMCVRGEGEYAFLQATRKIEKGESLSGIPNTITKEGESFSPSYEFPITDLDEYPPPAYELIDMDFYLAHEVNGYLREPPAFPIITSRGCPMKCVYCTVRSLYGQNWRHHSAKRVCDEIEYLMKNYGIKEFHFHDDSISADKKHLIAICEEMLERKLNISWTTPNGIAHWTLDKSILRLMKKAGCYRITFGIESGNPEVRKFVGKGGEGSLKQARELIRFANKIGMWTVATHIFGFPYETKEQMMDTVKYSVNSDVDFAVFYNLGYYPRTPVYEIARKEGIVDFEEYLDPMKEDSYIELSKAVNRDVRSVYFSAKEIADMASFAYGYFFRRRIISFLNPIRLIRKLWGVKEFKYGLKIFSRGVSLIVRFIKQKGQFTSYGIHVDEDKTLYKNKEKS